MPEAVISIRGANKTFLATRAVRDLDLDVPEGSLCGFLGPNGAGKTTTLRMIMSIIRPDEGSIRVLGGDALASKDRIGYLPEERGLYRKMRVGEYLTYIARLKEQSGPGLRARIEEWLERIELPDVFSKRCQELSKGMQQKVQFIAAIIHDPDLLILDEPFSGLDPVNTKLLNKLIDGLHHAGKTIIFSTHILHQAEQICDRIFLIDHGVKLLDASLDEIRKQFDPRTISCEPLDPTFDPMRVSGVTGVHREGPTLELSVEEAADPQVIMRSLLEASPMRSVELRRPTLEEVFVRTVMQNKGAKAAELAREELSHV